MLILRPPPGSAATLALAEAAGLHAVSAPIFTIVPLAWDAPDPGVHDALMLTSANAVRHAGPALGLYHSLPVYAVGRSTATAARAAGFTRIVTGSTDATALLATMAEDGVARPLHLAGREHRIPAHAPFAITRRIVYAAEPVDQLPAAASAAIEERAVALLHSARAAETFHTLLSGASIDPASISIAAISASAVAGSWENAVVADAPNDAALLAAAARLCDKA